jgi:hypothetical protein
MFPAEPESLNDFKEYCKQAWGLNVRSGWSAIEFSGAKTNSSSNIVFSNGLLDPWHRGGVLTNLSDSLIAVVIKNAAHHLDLRGSNPADPDSVKQARLIEIGQIKKWISQARRGNI